MNCQQCNEQLIEYLDGRLEAGRRAEVETHLAACAACRQRQEEFRALGAVLEEWQPTESSAGFDARLAEKIELAQARSWWPVWLRPVYVAALALLLVALGILATRPGSIVRQPVAVKTPPQVVAPVVSPQAGASQDEEVQLLENLAVLEDAQMLEEFDVLSEIGPAKVKARKKL